MAADFVVLPIDSIKTRMQASGTGRDYTEQAGSVSNKRTLVDLVATLNAPEDMAQGGMEYLKNVSLQFNTVWGQEQGVGGQTVDWYGFSAGMKYDFDLPVLGGDGNDVGRWFLALRGEWFEDPDGARTGGGLDHANMWGVTGTLGFRPAKVLLIRLEMRHDHGQASAGGGSVQQFSDGGRNAQTTVGLNVVANL